MALSGITRTVTDMLVTLQSHIWLTLAISSLVYLTSQRYKRGIWKIPGPFFASISGYWRAWKVAKGSWHETELELHRQYGPVVRIAPNVVCISDPRAIRTVYGLNTGFTKTDFYPIQQLRLGKLPLPNLFSTRNDELHANMKRPVAHIYSMSSMVTFEPYVDHCSKLFFSRLDELYVSTGDDCDLGEWLQWYAMDVIAELTFGKMFGCLAVGGDVGNLIKTLAQFEQYAAVIGQVPYLHKLLLGNPILPYLVPKLEDINQVLKFSLDRIRERNSDKESRHEDFLSKLYTAKADGKMSEADTVRHSSANVFAGSDTTAVALRATIDGLLLRPESYRKLQAEIDRKREQGELSSPVKYSEAQQMPYLQAVLKEAMRWHPSVAMLLERHVPKGGTVLCGIPIPANTIVGVNPWVVQRDRTIFGDDAHVFRPERWLEADTERFKIMDRAFLAFGGGSHTCIGRNISMMEMSKIIPSLLMEYDITRADPNARIRTVNYWFAVQKGLVVKLAKRKSLPQGPA